MNLPHWISLSVLTALPFPAVAQASPEPIAPSPALERPTALPAALVPLHRPEAEGQPTGELWAAGPDYKASFHDGPRFIPYLGSAYPHMQEVRWTTQSVRLGQQELLGAATQAVVVGDYRVEFDRGVVREAYDIRRDGLEQTFVIASAAAGGDLEVRGALSGLDAVARSGGHGPIELRDERGDTLVTYGAATAVDAQGRTWPMTTSCEHGQVVLRLAASAVAAAAFPLTVDPTINMSHSGPNGATVAESEVAVAAPSSIGQPAFAYTRWVAANDSDMFLAGNNTNGIWFADLTVGASAEQPAVAAVAATSKFVLAYRSLSAGVSRLRVHLRPQATTTLLSNSISPILVANQHDWRPTIGGTMEGSSGDQALIVFQREVTPTAAFADTTASSVVARLFQTTTSSGQFTTETVIAQGGNLDCERPAVNQVAEGGTAFSWVCVWQQYNNTIAGDDWDLVARRVDNTATISTGIWTSSLAAANRHQLGPKVAGIRGRYAVLFASSDVSITPTGISGQDVRVERFDWAHGDTFPDPAGDQPAVVLATGSIPVRQANGICMDPSTLSHWGYVYRVYSTSLPAGYAGRVGYHGQALEAPMLVAPAGPSITNLTCSWYRSGPEMRLAYGEITAGILTVWDGYLSHPTPVAASNYGSSCTNAGINWVGPAAITSYLSNQLIGSELSGIQVSGGAFGPGWLHIPAVSLASANLPLVHPAIASGCSLLVDSGASFLGTLPGATGASATWTLPLPENLPSFTLYAQCWSLNPTTMLLVSGPGLSVPLEH